MICHKCKARFGSPKIDVIKTGGRVVGGATIGGKVVGGTIVGGKVVRSRFSCPFCDAGFKTRKRFWVLLAVFIAPIVFAFLQ